MSKRRHVRSRSTGRHERGSTLLLFPSAVLVVFLLSAIAVDLSLIHLGRRELLRTASQAADDAAAMVDTDYFRSGEGIRIDMDAASNIVAVHLETAQLPGELVGTPTVELGPRPGTVVVRAQLRIDHFFGAVVPGAPDSEIVTVEVTGEVLEL